MSAHTPGPWYVGTQYSYQGRHIYAEKMVSTQGGETWHPLIATADDDEHLGDWQANARLIAASPVMLAALITAREFISHDRNAFAGTCTGAYGEMEPQDAAVLGDYDKALLQIDAAIRSAT